MNLIKNKQGGKYLIENNKKLHIPNTETREVLGYDENTFPEDEKLLDLLRPGENVTDIKKARLVCLKGNSNQIYAIFESPKHEKRLIPDVETLDAIRRNIDEVEILPSDEFNKISSGEDLRSVKKWDTKPNKNSKTQTDKPLYVAGDYVSGDKVNRDKNTTLKQVPQKSNWLYFLIISIIITVASFVIIEGKLPKLLDFSEINSNLVTNENIPTTFNLESSIENTLLPKDIIESLNNLAVQQRLAVAKSYEGQNINWKVYYYAHANDWFLASSENYDSNLLINCDVGENQYPEFRVLEDKDTIIVEASIISVESNKIRLKDCILLFNN